MIAEVADQAFLFAEVEGWALIRVLGQMAVEADRGLVQRQQPTFHR